MKLSIIANTSANITTNTYNLSLGDRLLTYIEYLNDKGKVIDCNLRDVDGDEINDPALLEQVQEFVDGLEPVKEDAAEQQRRDEKNGLYHDKVDVSN
jgi:hypothetical protein